MEGQSVRIQRHPFSAVGYWHAQTMQKTATVTGETLYQSTARPHLFAIVRESDGRTMFLVRGQTYSTLAAARKIA